MNSIVKIIIFSATLCAALAVPAANRWELVPDGDGRLHLVDLTTVDDDASPAYNPETDIIFTVCTARNPTSCQRIQWNDMNTVRNSQFNAARPTVFTVHGWTNDGTHNTNVLTRQSFLRIGDYNMITVDWSVGAGANYITSRNRVGPTGVVVARFVDNLHQAGLIRFPDLILVGHSLGAHIVGHAGKAVTRGRVQYIMGMDPAGPLFSVNDPTTRLAATDGVYVEAIHTNFGALGITGPIAQVDMYPNFGRSQPGCNGDSCSHQRVVDLFAESVERVFTAQRCTSFDGIGNNVCTPSGGTGRMGGPTAKPGLNGIFHLTTNAQSPFSRG